MKASIYFSIALSMLILAGCDPKPIAPANRAPAPVVTQAVPQPETKKPDPMPVAPMPPTETVKAEYGVGERGRSYGGGLITEPVKQYWGLRERAVFDIQLPQAMRHYKALHEDMAPQTQEEFDKEIIAASGIKLPKLPMGQRYIYDPKTEQLLVERPRRAGDN